MKLIAVNFGRNTNSSSSHTLVYSNNKLDDIITDEVLDGFYGWSWFRLASKKEKIKYGFAIFNNMLNEKERIQLIEFILNNFKDIDISEKDLLYDSNIDHYSCVNYIPGDVLMAAKAFITFITDEKLAIYGGNDHDMDAEIDYIGDILSETYSIDIISHKYHVYIIVGDIKFIYSEYNEEELIKKYQEDNMLPPPYMVDFKITNKCSNNCPFCYQHSNPNGSEAPFKKFKKTFETLIECGVKEFAIGGGNIMELSYLKDFFKYISNFMYDKKINLTINVKDLPSFLKIDDINRRFVGLGISIDHINDVNILKKYYEQLSARHIAIHLIAELLPEETFLKLINRLTEIDRFQILLLGFKGNKPHNWNFEYIFNKLKEYIDKDKIKAINVDTLLIRQIGKEFIYNIFGKNNFNLLYQSEGLFSKYIDIVDNIIGPSSYEKDKFKKINDLEKDLRDPNLVTY